MPKVIEVSEEDFVRNETLRKTVEAMLQHPKARRKILEARKEYDPNAVIPELDQQKPVEEAVAAVSKQFEDFKKELTEKETKADAERKRADLTGKFESGRARMRAERWTDDGIKAVEELMEKHGILDHEVGIAYFQKLHPPAEPVTPEGGTGAWNFMDLPKDGADDIKRLIETKGESDAVLNKMVRETLSDFRGQVRR